MSLRVSVSSIPVRRLRRGDASASKRKASARAKHPEDVDEDAPLPLGVVFTTTPAAKRGFGEDGDETTARDDDTQQDGEWRRCARCGARPCAFSNVDRTSGRWKCVFCFTWNALGAGTSASSRYEFVRDDHAVFVSNATRRAAGTVVIVVDEAAAAAQLVTEEDLGDALAGLPDDLNLALVVFGGGAARIMRLGETQRGRVVADLFPTHTRPDTTNARAVAAHQNDMRRAAYVAPLHQCKETLLAAVGGLRSRVSAEGHRRAAAAAAVHDRREAGRAVEYALLLLEAAGAPSGLILMVAGRTTARARGVDEDDDVELHAMEVDDERDAAAYFASLASQAAHANYAIEVLCDSRSHDVAALLSLGRVSPLPPDPEGVSTTLRALLSHSTESSGYPVELRHSTSVRVAHALGALDVRPLPGGGGATMKLIRGCALTVYFELAGDGEGAGANANASAHDDDAAEAFFQCVSVAPAETTNAGGGEREQEGGGVVERVSTRRVALLREQAQQNLVLDAVDEKVSVVVLAKALVALTSSAADAEGRGAASLDDEAIKARVRSLVRVLIRALYSSRAPAPQDTSSMSIPFGLYHLHRSPLLGAMLGAWPPGEIMCMRARFLGANVEEATLLMSPRLVGWHVGRDVSFRELSLSTLWLRSDFVLVCDQLTDVFVWVGSAVPPDAPERERARVLAVEWARHRSRFPSSRVWVFDEDDPEARRLRVRLAPDHKNTLERVAALDPVGLSLDQLKRLHAKLSERPTDEPTYERFVSIV